MKGTRARHYLFWAGLAAAITAGATAGFSKTVPPDDRTVTHVLNRIAFGPRPGDLERVRAVGIQRYIDEQLRPERIPDSGMNARLAALQTIGMSSRELAEKFERPAIEARKEKKATGDAPTPDEKAMQQKANSVVVELSEQKLLRAIYSERQLQEVLTDFWFNHFNVDARKGADRFMLTEYEREAIRPHVLGKFRDLLEATAKSPAMLFYLDNWMSADPNGPHAEMRPPRVVRGPFGRPMVMAQPPRMPAQGKNAPKGLNENYGRELMELHTLGVDGGYAQRDVTEVARAFTGWTIQNPRQGGGFKFEPRLHDMGQKVVLGHVIKAGGGERDGEEVLDILAKHPSTARFIATKLVRRFISDTPPPALVDRASERFRSTDGDLREVMRAILMSPEFTAPDAFRAKVKTPFEFIVSAVRALGAEVTDAAPLVRATQQMGMPLYQCQPPTGYKDTADAWVNTGALVSRMNFAVQITGGKLPGVVPTTLDWVSETAATDFSDATRATIAKATTPPQIAALTLGAPEFQRR
jgi:uncharacterized protein (DUF1800 family)